MKISATIALTILFLVLLGLVVIYTGFYNVAADKPDHALVAWVMKTVRDRGIETRADEVTIPADIASMSIEDGFRHYHATCEKCHGGPGVAPSEIGRGLYPRPPALQSLAGHLSEQTIFWVVKHGIKLAGMPSFGVTHPDQELLHVVAFVKKLPDITSDDYRALAKKGAAKKH